MIRELTVCPTYNAYLKYVHHAVVDLQDQLHPCTGYMPYNPGFITGFPCLPFLPAC